MLQPNVYGQTTRTVGTGANYAKLQLAFAAINSGAITGQIVLQITGSTTETVLPQLNASGTGSANYTSVLIYPTGSFTISTALNSATIDLNGADNVTIDGRIGGSGTPNSLTIIGTSTGNAATAIRFVNSAENNTIKYCTIKGASAATAGGIILFSTASAGNGNDGNTIDNNKITADAAGKPVNGIYSAGTAGRENSGNAITNNEIFDVWRNNSSSYNIQILANSTDFTISGNSFYETTNPFAPGIDGLIYNAIRIVNTLGNNFIVSGNYIGGQAAQCGGSALTVSFAKTHQFQAIYLSVGTGTASSVQGNVIRNINYTSVHLTPWFGINIIGGSVNIGTTTGNIIGAATGTGSITVTTNQDLTHVSLISLAGAGTINCKNNTLGAVTVANSANNETSFYGINSTATGVVSISNNKIGSSTTASSINSTSTAIGSPQEVVGINNTGNGTLTISNNTISKMTNSTTNITAAKAGLINGITSTTGTLTVSDNTIYDLTIANSNTSATNTAAVCGIALTGSTLKTVTGNIIYNLSNSYATFAGNIIGIYFAGNTGANAVSRNFIRGLSVTGGTSTTASLYGIKIAAGATTYSNNIITLGGNTTTTIYGIYRSKSVV